MADAARVLFEIEPWYVKLHIILSGCSADLALTAQLIHAAEQVIDGEN